MRPIITILALLILLLAQGQLAAQESTGVVLNAHAMAYHKAEANTYIFGGATASQVVNDLWVIDKDQLRLLEVNEGPSPRTFASMVYDEDEQALFLFGGSKVLFGKTLSADLVLNDSWMFKNGQWTQLNPSHQPKSRAHAAMAYDSSRKRVVLFGGYELVDGQYTRLNDIWEFYGNDWHEVTTDVAPSPRLGSAMVYHQRLERVFLFGGNTQPKKYGPGTGESWVLGDEIWKIPFTEQPANVFDAAMAYDSKNDRVLRFGGWLGSKRSHETWAFQNGGWEQLSAPGPSARNHSQMVYDEQNDRILLFGGHNGPNVLGDLWVFKNGNWQVLLETPSQKREANGH